MNLFTKLREKYATLRYVRQLPFYLMREYGVKRIYRISEVDVVVWKYKFSVKHMYVGYAISVSESDYVKATDGEKDLPSRDTIRLKIADKYGLPRGYDAFDLMALSQYKDNWITTAPVDGSEYWRYVNTIDKIVVEENYGGTNVSIVLQKKGRKVTEAENSFISEICRGHRGFDYWEKSMEFRKLGICSFGPIWYRDADAWLERASHLKVIHRTEAYQ